ncbi:MAG: gfo/Idh/MocA family oxidoreductase [Verrucomicrobia bacterium]|nr:gfo/Idh/MocA family oxidoreductase [Verrucomicrobiota bacterium]
MKRPAKLSPLGLKQSSRREFLSWSSKAAAASALVGVTIPRVHAAGDNTIRLALIGCGGRGSGAVVDASQSPYGPVKLYAMADLFEKRLAASHKVLSQKLGGQVDVPADRKFIGFDAYKKAIDLLRPGDVAMLTGYAGWRPVQLEYAVAKGVNVFMEKSFACDPPGVRRIIKAGEEAKKKNLKIAAGLMARHAPNRQELIKRIRDGQLGPIQFIRTFRMQPCGTLPRRKPENNDLQWQISHFTHFLWVSGGLFAEMNIHQVDEICWIKDAWPVSAHGVGGRIANSTDCGQNLDSLSIEWTFADGTKAYHVTRWTPKCHNDFRTYIHGTDRAAAFPWLSGHRDDLTQIYKDQRCSPDNIAWQADEGLFTYYQAEWNVLLDAIHNNKPHNEAKRAAMSNLADIMGRAAVHMGRVITWDEAMKSDFRFCPNIDSLTDDSEPPIKADAEGRYPMPIPGQWTEI